MAKYRIDFVSDLARQMAFTPVRARAQQVTAAELLLHDLLPSQAYPRDYVVYRITGFRPKSDLGGDLLTGLALRHDLGLLIEQVSDSLDFAVADIAEPVLSIEDVSRRFDVTSKTIQRWRRKGLPARRFRFSDGKRRVGFILSNVERFVAVTCERTDPTPGGAIRPAVMSTIQRMNRRLSARHSPQLVAIRIARRVGRTPMTVLHTLRQLGLNSVTPAVTDADRDAVAGLYRRSRTLRPVVEAGFTPASAYQLVRDDRADRLGRRRVRFIDDPLYHGNDAAHAIAEILAQPELVPSTTDGRVPRDLPNYFKDLYRAPLLSPGRERALFLGFNYHKCRFVTARRQVDLSMARIRQIRHLEQLLAAATAVKNEIVRANLRLVVSVARRHVRPGVGLMDLVSEGNVILMRAVEGFDPHKGFRFSTYATLALMKGFAAFVPSLRDSRAVGVDSLDAMVDRKQNDRLHRRIDRDHLSYLMSRLDDRERRVLRAHYGLNAEPPVTLEQVGRQLGLSKQRVRQIERTALAKLRG